MFRYRPEILLGVFLIVFMALRLFLFQEKIDLYESERNVPLSDYMATPSGRGYAFDPYDYLLLAHRIASGRGYTYEDGTPTTFRPPMYPVFLSLLRPGFPVASALPILANFAMSTLTICLLVFVIANGASTPLAVLAVPILALNSKWIEADSHIWSEPLFMLLLSISVLVCSFHKPRKQKSATYLSVAGIPIGLSCLVSPVALLTIPIFSIFLWLFNNVKRKIILLGFLVCSALIILPWTLRNALTTHSFVPVSSNGGMNFYIGNNSNSIKWSGQIYGSKVLSEIRQGTSSISETYIDKEFYKRSFEYIKSKPIAFVSRFISKAKEFWTFFPHGSPVKRLITIVLLFPCVVLGAFRVLRHKMFGGILALVLLSVGLFTYSSYWLWWRMALPYFPFAWLLVFHGVLLIIARIVNRFPQFRWMEETILA